MKSNVLKLKTGAASVALFLAAAHIAVAAPVAAPKNPKVEPRSYEEFLGANPHPDWLDGSSPSGQVMPLANEVEMPALGNTKLVTQDHTNPTALPSPCSAYFGNSPLTIMETKVIPSTSVVEVATTLQPSIPEGNGFAAVSLLCYVKQGEGEGSTRSCSGTKGEPNMVQRIKQSQTALPSAWRGSNVVLAGYNGYVTGLTPGVEATVTIAARTFSQPIPVLGQVCFGSLEVLY